MGHVTSLVCSSAPSPRSLNGVLELRTPERTPFYSFSRDQFGDVSDVSLDSSLQSLWGLITVVYVIGLRLQYCIDEFLVSSFAGGVVARNEFIVSTRR